MGRAQLRALVVDDNADHALLMERALREDLGASPLTAASAREALEQLQRDAPDVVVLDYRLPDAEGWSALAEIRAHVDAPIVVVTGQGSENAAAEAFKAGAADYLPKEGDYLRALPRAVVRAVESHKRRRRELAQLKKTSQALATSLEFEGAVDAALKGAMALLDADGAWLLLPNSTGTLELVGACGLRGEAARNPKAKFRSRISTPLTVGDRDRPGLLCVGAKTAGRFGSHHQELLSALAGHAASALSNAELFASLERAKAHWERTFDSISDPIVISDHRFRILRINRAAARALDLPLRRAAGRVCHRVLLGSDQPCPWHDGLARGVSVSTDRYLPHLKRWFCFSAFPFQDERRRTVGVVHVLRDITEERNLQQRVLEAQKLSALGELVAGVAHELNNPLTGILGFSHLLLRKDLEPHLRDDLEKIAGEARRAARIVRNLAAFARRPSYPGLARRPVDVGELLRNTIELRDYQLRVQGIELDVQLPEDLPRTMADPDELQQVFLNLINNAEQAMAAQEPPKRLTVRGSRKQNGAIGIEFRDTGPGLPEKLRDRIFDPFFTTKEAGRGTGLGLSVCYGIIRGHDGNIAAANSPDGGAVFTIELPVRDASGARPGRPDAAAQVPSVAPARILVVDDEPVVADFVRRTLAEDRHHITVAERGGAALDELSQAAYDLVICDLKLPDMPGPELYSRAAEASPELRDRFLFLTGDTLGPATAGFLRGRADPWLEKPLMPDELRRVVGQHLSRRSKADE
jgi:two-component system NtrC family sensor kinase